MTPVSQFIKLRGVSVHNLRRIDLDLPHNQLIVICGVSGSGKTSLALDTLYAEGQRRYIESFSAYTRQFLQRLERPDADVMEGLPPAVAVTHDDASRSGRATVGTATEIVEFLRLLFARLGQVVCQGCHQPLQAHSAESIAQQIRLPPGQRLFIAFPRTLSPGESLDKTVAELREQGYVRGMAGEQTCDLSAELPASLVEAALREGRLLVIVDRLTSGKFEEHRLTDSLELAMREGSGICEVWCEETSPPAVGSLLDKSPLKRLDERTWRRMGFSSNFACSACGRQYLPPEPRLFNFNSPLGACPRCEGFGNLMDLDPQRIVPDENKSLRDGAIAPWNSPAYAHEKEALLKLAAARGFSPSVPYRELSDDVRQLIWNGAPEAEYGGVTGFFAALERQKYKMHVRVFLSRWRSFRDCPDCGGARLRPEARAVKVREQNIAQLCELRIEQALSFLRSLAAGLSFWEKKAAGSLLDQVASRLEYLTDVGLGYLALARPLRTLSGGETQRVALTAALGSNLVNMLYVLDEPSVGLHAADVSRLLGAIQKLRQRGNTVVVVEHEEAILRAADQVVEIGPGAGDRGGQVVFQGPPSAIVDCPTSLTGDYLAGRRGTVASPRRRQPEHGWIRLAQASGNNLKNITVEFPLGMLCVVSGVSGAGKSSLVQDTLFGALCRRKKIEVEQPLPYREVYGDGQIDEVVLVDQSPIGRSPRSNPVTYIKAFDEIRGVFAETLEARTHNYTAGHFSFNVDGGRCPACEGDGHLKIDMQFLPDVFMKCDQCGGRRYRREILEVTYRGKSIADVLEMTAREAFQFFRGQTKVQTRLKRLLDVGLDYLRLNQGANTLSAGEAQRLKLAGYLSTASRNRTLFLLDEPTTGLHFNDVVQLLDCFDALLEVGHSLIVVEHNLQIMLAADYIIDLGPGAGDQGGQVVAAGTPEKVAQTRQSVTGRLLSGLLARG